MYKIINELYIIQVDLLNIVYQKTHNMKTLYTLVLIFGSIFSQAQHLKNYQFYNQKGKKIEVEKLATALANYDVVLFGEHHNNSVNHWLQLQVLKQLHQNFGQNLHIGFEMFERDNQTQLSDFVNQKIDDKVFQDSTRLWNNYKTDYKPLVEFTKTHHLKTIATNVPRRYASQVAKEGLESLNQLDDQDKKWMVKLPFQIDYDAPGYPEMIKMMGEHAGLKAKQFVAAQAIKDATMAESILNNLPKNGLFLHFHGDYHSKNYGGIYWYLKHYQPQLKIAVISILESDDQNLSIKPPKDENFVMTDFVLVLPADAPKSF